MDDISYSGNEAWIGDTHIEFEYPISKTIQIENRVLVLLDSTSGKSPGADNILAFDLEGNELWRIQKPDWNPQMFVSLSSSDSTVKARNHNSIVYEVDIGTGDIEPLHMVK